MDEHEQFEEREILAREQTSEYDFVRLTFADLDGIARSRSVPRREFKHCIKDGSTMFSGFMYFGPRSALNYKADEEEGTHFCNVKFLPMPDTFHELPWAAPEAGSGSDKDKKLSDTSIKVGQVLCESFWMTPGKVKGDPQEFCTRYVARRQLDRLKDLGYVLKSAFEAEFTVYDSKTFQPIFQGHEVTTTLRLAQCERYLYEMGKQLFESGVDIESYQVEHGSGQFELGMKPSLGIKGADAMFLLKQGLKEMSHQLGWIATFMAKPFPNSSPNRLHYNHSVWADVEATADLQNRFHDPANAVGLSDLSRHWIAGLLKHAKAMAALCCPTINCYRRLNHTDAVPHKINWGIDYRRTAFRAKSYSSTATYIESRLPSGACNPYLVLACTVAAGIDGIVNRLECPPPAQPDVKDKKFLNQQNPNTDKDLYFPDSLEEALESLEADVVLTEALGPRFVKRFVQTKRDLELPMVKELGRDSEEIWSKERELYFEFL